MSHQDSNLNKVNQNHLCCHYTMGQKKERKAHCFSDALSILLPIAGTSKKTKNETRERESVFAPFAKCGFGKWCVWRESNPRLNLGKVT